MSPDASKRSCSAIDRKRLEILHLPLQLTGDSSAASRLTVDGERNLLLAGSHPRHHRPANVFPCVLLSHGLQRQEVLVAEDLQDGRREKKEVESKDQDGQKRRDAFNLLRYRQSSAEVWRGGIKEERNKAPGQFLYLKGQLCSIIKIQFRVLDSVEGGERLASPFDVDRSEGGMSQNSGSRRWISHQQEATKRTQSFRGVSEGFD